MVTIEELRQKVNDQADNLVARVNGWRDEMFAEIEQAEKGEIMAELQRINVRIGKIEERLPEPGVVSDED